MNHSTVDLDTTQWLAAECAAIGCSFVDAPFTGSKQAAHDGQLMYFLSGSSAAIAKAADLLQPTASRCLPMGDIGRATVFKLSTNLIAACQIQALAEAHALCLQHGITGDEFAAALESHGTTSPLTRLKLPRILSGHYETHFSLDNMRKDSTYALALAEQKNLDLPAMRAVSERMTELCQRGLADDDYSALAQPYQQRMS
jgi:3-hydroxyisobutyrate dehydrogenase/glyoxylate/succinic semialdehyde reductase